MSMFLLIFFLTVLPQNSLVADLPLKVLPTSIESDLPMFVFISGDGGWNTFNESLCDYLNRKGIPVVALDSRKYFWSSKTPEEVTDDMVSVIEAYQKEWKREKFVLAGYSFGADIVPFVQNRLPLYIKSKLASSIMISPDNAGDFEVHLTDMLNLGLSKGKYDVIKELQKSDYKNIVVFFGSDESQNNREAFQQIGVKTETLEGDHHFDSGYEALADRIMSEIEKK